METLVKIVHVMVCLFLMLTVLLQAGKGGGMGAAFGGGTSMGTVFGGSGAGNFLKKLTVAAAAIFMITSMTLAWMATPSTDPLKEYWAQQQQAATERERAHKAAIEDAEKKGATDGTDDGATEDLEGIDKPEQEPGAEGEGGEGTEPADGTEPAEGDDAIDTPDPADKTPAPGAATGTPAPEAKKAPAPESVKPPKPKKVNPAQPVQPIPTPEPAPEPAPTAPGNE
jgi:preprotein translocase subunit SecG